MSSTKTFSKQTCSENQIGNLLIGAVTGSIAGAAAALLLAPKSGERLRKDIANTYHDITDKTQDLADNIKNSAVEFISKSENNSNVLLGTIGGGILVAAAVYLLSSHEEEESSQLNGIADKIKDAGKSVLDNLNSIDWVETAKDIVNELNEKNNYRNGTSVKERIKTSKEESIKEVLNWA